MASRPRDYYPARGLLTAFSIFAVIYCLMGSVLVLGGGMMILNDQITEDGNGLGILFIMIALAVLSALVYFIIMLKLIGRFKHNAMVVTRVRYEHSPGWSIGYFFIPILNLFRPYQAVAEMWEGCKCAPSNGMVSGWWTCYLISIIGSRVTGQMGGHSETLKIACMIDFGILPVSIMTVVLIWKIFARLEERQDILYNRMLEADDEDEDEERNRRKRARSKSSRSNNPFEAPEDFD